MNGVTTFWNAQSRGGKIRLALGVLLVTGITVALAFWALRTPYAVLFTQLTDADAASITEQLKRQKAPYRLEDGGATITVPAALVHETRLRLMSSGMPLAGGVGFELFDKQGLGATEQSQRVSYQRALQGELARTIGALVGVKQARIHLVLPESTLFKRDRQEARAAVTLTVASGASLAREQITGIQRLVASSVAGLEPGKVVVTDQRGIVLSMAEALAGGSGASEARLQMKRDIEEYVTHKVARLLDGTYGPGQAIVSVDATLNFDEITRTVRDLLPVRPTEGSEGAGVRRRRQVQSSAAAGSLIDSAAEPGSASSPANASTEVEYEYGQRVEQVIAAPGGVTRLSVGVIVPGDLNAEKQQSISNLVRMAAGLDEARGDAIVVQSLDQLGAPPVVQADVEPVVAEPVAAAKPEPPVNIWNRRPSAVQWAAVGTVGVVLFAVLFLRRRSTSPAGGAPLSTQQRHQLLLEVQRALGEGTAVNESGVKS